MIYLCFHGDTYYPNGGARDFRGAFATEEEAVAFMEGGAHGEGYMSWGHVARFDGERLEVVVEWRNEQRV